MKTPNSALQLRTYQAGMLQAAAYRNLNAFLTHELAPLNLAVNEWAVLGLLADGALRPSDLATAMAVKTPMISRILNSLIERKLIVEADDKTDQRSKSIELTNSGKLLLDENEARLRPAMRTYLQAVSREDLAIYVKVLDQLSKLSG